MSAAVLMFGSSLAAWADAFAFQSMGALYMLNGVVMAVHQVHQHYRHLGSAECRVGADGFTVTAGRVWTRVPWGAVAALAITDGHLVADIPGHPVDWATRFVHENAGHGHGLARTLGSKQRPRLVVLPLRAAEDLDAALDKIETYWGLPVPRPSTQSER